MLAGLGGRDVVAPGLEAEAQRARFSDGSSSMTKIFAMVVTVASRARRPTGARRRIAHRRFGASSYQISLAVRFDERLGDGESESGAAALVELRESIEDRLAVLRRDAGSLVASTETTT